MAPAISLMTAEQFWENAPDGRCELVRGEVVVMSPSSSEHGWIVMNVSIPIGSFVKEHDLGYVFGAETGFVIHRDPDSVRAPDVAFVRKGRVQGGLSPQFFPGPPDLAVEVLSPRDSASEVQEKTEDWLRAGCHEVWLVDPRRKSATRCTLKDDALVWQSVQELASDLLPGLSLEVKTLFQ